MSGFVMVNSMYPPEENDELKEYKKYFIGKIFRDPIYYSTSIFLLNSFRLWEEAIIKENSYINYYNGLMHSRRTGPGGVYYFDVNGYAGTILYGYKVTSIFKTVGSIYNFL